MRRFLRRQIVLLPLYIVLAFLFLVATPALAQTTADVTVTATPSYIAISDNATTYDFATVAASSVTNTTMGLVGITNVSSVQTDITISVAAGNWTGGLEWFHSNTAVPGIVTAGLLATRAADWTGSIVIVKNAGPDYIYENCPATTNFAYSLSLLAPTEFSDGVQKSNTVTVSAVAG